MKLIKKENRGGARRNSGRKPLPKEEKKSLLYLYLKDSTIESHGGKEALKLKLEKYANRIK